MEMKAVVYSEYGPSTVLRMKQVPKPVPRDNEILLSIRATAVNSGDLRLRKADPFAVRLFFGLIRPKIQILGSVFSGEVESVGKKVTRFKAGDEVFGHTDIRFGSYAEYICIPEDGSLAMKPVNISHNEAASIPFGAVTALHFIKKANLKPNQKVVIVGASGAVGSAAVQLAKAYGAIVTGICSSANMGWVKSIGADRVIDYTKADFKQNGETYDLIFDTVNAISVSQSLHSITQNGILISSAAGMREVLQGLWISLTSKRRVITGVIRHSGSDIVLLKGLIETGKLKAVIDRTYPLEQIAEAHAYVETGHKRGNISISIK